MSIDINEESTRTYGRSDESQRILTGKILISELLLEQLDDEFFQNIVKELSRTSDMQSQMNAENGVRGRNLLTQTSIVDPRSIEKR